MPENLDQTQIPQPRQTTVRPKDWPTITEAPADYLHLLDGDQGCKTIAHADLAQQIGGAHVSWRGFWQPQTVYERNDMSRQGNWLGVANKQTTDAIQPTLVGEPSWRSGLDDAPPWETNSDSSAMYVVGQRYSVVADGVVTAVRLWAETTPDPLSYAVWLVINPETSPQYYNLVPEFSPFAGETGQWLYYSIPSMVVRVGDVYDMVKIIRSLTQSSSWTANWNYAARTGNPGIGAAYQDGDVISFNYIDADSTNRQAQLLAVIPGDRITFNNVTYSVIAVDQNPGSVSISVSPQVSQPDALYPFTFTKFAESVINFATIADYYASVANVQGFENPGQWAPDLPKNENAYGVDVYAQGASASPDWDILAVTGGSGGTGGGGETELTQVNADSVDDMILLDPPDGATVTLRGYYAVGDGGQGLFKYDANSTATEDGGSVIAPVSGVGRFLRVPQGDPLVEWFGGVADAAADGSSGTDNGLPAENCLKAYGSVRFGEGTYGFLVRDQSGTFACVNLNGVAKANVAGAGRAATTLVALEFNGVPDPYAPGGFPGMAYFFMLRNCPNVRVAGIGFDCRFGNVQSTTGKPISVCAVLFDGSDGAVLHDLKAVNWNTAQQTGVAKECFVFIGGNYSGDATHQGPRISGIECHTVAPTGTLQEQPELSFVTVAGWKDALITDCWFHDLYKSSTSHTNIHLITVTGCNNAVVAHNRAQDVDGEFVYTDNRGGQGLSVTDNATTRLGGIFAYFSNASVASNPPGQFTNLLIADNNVDLAFSADRLSYGTASNFVCAVFLQCEQFANQPLPLFSGVLIAENRFTAADQSGQGVSRPFGVRFYAAPAGTYFEDVGAGYLNSDYRIERVLLENNVFNYPTDAGVETGTLLDRYDYPCIYVGGNVSRMSAPHILDLRGNRTDDGRLVRAYGNEALREGSDMYRPTEKNIGYNRLGYFSSGSSYVSDVVDWPAGATGKYIVLFGSTTTTDPQLKGSDDRVLEWEIYHPTGEDLNVILPPVADDTYYDKASRSNKQLLARRTLTFRCANNGASSGAIKFWKQPGGDPVLIATIPKSNSTTTVQLRSATEASGSWAGYIFPSDAPRDGQTYGRKDGSWAVAGLGGSGTAQAIAKWGTGSTLGDSIVMAESNNSVVFNCSPGGGRGAALQGSSVNQLAFLMVTTSGGEDVGYVGRGSDARDTMQVTAKGNATTARNLELSSIPAGGGPTGVVDVRSGFRLSQYPNLATIGTDASGNIVAGTAATVQGLQDRIAALEARVAALEAP